MAQKGPFHPPFILMEGVETLWLEQVEKVDKPDELDRSIFGGDVAMLRLYA